MSTEKTMTVKVKNSEDLRLALAAGYEAYQIEMDPAEAVQAAVAAAEATAKAEHERELAAAVEAHGREREALLQAAHAQLLPDQKAATIAERERILGIQKLTPRGFEGVAAAAIAEGLPVHAFSLKVLAEQQDRGITLDSIRRDAPPPAAHAPPSDDSKPGTGRMWSAFENAEKRRM